jgi:hypothetical protein
LLPKLTVLQAQLAQSLRTRKAQLAKICSKLTRSLPRANLLLARLESKPARRLLQLARLTDAGQAQLAALKSTRLRQLFCRKSKLTCLPRRLQCRTRACLSQLSCQACRLLLTRQLLFKRLLRTLRSRFKTAGPHLGRGPRLLLQHIALQLLLRDSLT